MRISVFEINVYCDTLTRGHNLFGGYRVNCDTTVEELTQLVSHIPAPTFVKKMEVHEYPLNDDECEGSIDIYVSYQLKRKPITRKKQLESEEMKSVEALVADIRIMLEHLGTVPLRKDQ